jgi:hypothetical protein
VLGAVFLALSVGFLMLSHASPVRFDVHWAFQSLFFAVSVFFLHRLLIMRNGRSYTNKPLLRQDPSSGTCLCKMIPKYGKDQ